MTAPEVAKVTKLNAPTIPYVRSCSPTIGGDPEFFFRENGVVIGAERVLPAVGLSGGHSGNKIIIDGVQGEFNMHTATCREHLASYMATNLSSLYTAMKVKGEGITADFSRTVEITQEELDKLSDETKVFGCSPSKSIYRAKGMDIKKVDPLKYRIRAAGGHIHLGHGSYGGMQRALTTDAKKTVAMLDLICGNTSVLIDRDPGNIERRKLYGRAGEYRLPKHGLEYRTLSNYWLHSTPLFSLAMGLARHALMYIADDANHKVYYDAFMSKVKPKKVRDAINNNDFDLAMENFEAIKPLLLDSTRQANPYAPLGYSGMAGRIPIDIDNIEDFMYFVKMMNEQGINKVFPQDPMKHWMTGTRTGFYNYLAAAVRPKRMKELAKPTVAEAPAVMPPPPSV